MSATVPLLYNDASIKISPVAVKVARDRRGKVVQLKLEYEELKRLAERSGRSLREITGLVQRAAWEKLAGESALKQSGHAGQSSPF